MSCTRSAPARRRPRRSWSADILGPRPDETEYGKCRWPQMPLETTDAALHHAASGGGPAQAESTLDAELHLADERLQQRLLSRPCHARGSAGFDRSGDLAGCALAMVARYRRWPDRARSGPARRSAARRRDDQCRGVAVLVICRGRGRKRIDWASSPASRSTRSIAGNGRSADFDVPDRRQHRFAIDALAVKYGDGAPADRKA